MPTWTSCWIHTRRAESILSKQRQLSRALSRVMGVVRALRQTLSADQCWLTCQPQLDPNHMSSSRGSTRSPGLQLVLRQKPLLPARVGGHLRLLRVCVAAGGALSVDRDNARNRAMSVLLRCAQHEHRRLEKSHSRDGRRVREREKKREREKAFCTTQLAV